MDIDIAIDTGRRYQPHSAVLIYRDEGSGECLAEHHRAYQQGSEFHVAEARPLTSGDLTQLIEALGVSALVFIPPQVVAASALAVAWWLPAQPRPLFFCSSSDRAVNALSGQVFPQPPLLLVARRTGLSVYALEQGQRPEAGTALMCAPYFNVFPNHGVCRGTTPFPETASTADTGAWAQAFFGSNFTHHAAGTRRLSAFDGTHAELWQAARARGSFDTAWLLPAGCTLAQALK